MAFVDLAFNSIVIILAFAEVNWKSLTVPICEFAEKNESMTGLHWCAYVRL